MHRFRRLNKVLAEKIHETLAHAAHGAAGSGSEGESESDGSSESEWDVEHAIGEKARVTPCVLPARTCCAVNSRPL